MEEPEQLHRVDSGPKLQKNQLVELERHQPGVRRSGHRQDRRIRGVCHRRCSRRRGSARITKQKKRYAEARAERIVTPSQDRIPHRCPSFGTCGGCVWQGLDYGVQLEYKTRQVRESLEHLGGLEGFEMLPIAGMTDPWRYRNRADFSIGITQQGAIIGFRPPGRWDLVLPISECHLLDPGIEQGSGRGGSVASRRRCTRVGPSPQ